MPEDDSIRIETCCPNTIKKQNKGLFLNINQLDALNFVISLFQASTCFEHHVLIVRRAKLYYTVSGIITPIGGRPVHRVLSQSVHGTDTYRSSKHVEA